MRKDPATGYPISGLGQLQVQRKLLAGKIRLLNKKIKKAPSSQLVQERKRLGKLLSQIEQSLSGAK